MVRRTSEQSQVAALDAIREWMSSEHYFPTVMATVNRKGGVGKSTTAATLAAALAMGGMRVGVIDTDDQGHMALMFDMPEEDGLFRALIEQAPLPDVVRRVPRENYASSEIPNRDGDLLLLPSGERTHRIPHELPEGSGFAFIELTDQMMEEFDLDVIVVDTHPTMSKLDGAVYTAVDGYIIPVECERLAFDGLEKVTEQLTRQKLSRQRYLNRSSVVAGILPNKFRGNTELHRVNVSALVEHYKHPHMLGKAHNQVRVDPIPVFSPMRLLIGWANAVNFGQTIFAYAPASQEAEEAWTFVEQVVRRMLAWQNGSQ